MPLREVLGQAVVEIIGDMTKFNADLDTVQKQMTAVGGAMQNVGATLSATVTAPVVAFGASAVRTFTDFQQGMSRVQALSGATGGELAKLTQVAQELGSTTRFSATEAAQGMQLLAQGGFSVRDIMQAMPGLLDLAAAAGTGFGEASGITANILAGFGLQANQAARAADVLAMAANTSQADVSTLGLSMRDVAPQSRAMGISFEETTAALALMSNAGIKGAVAGTALRNILLGLTGTSKESATTMAQLGINAFDASGKMLPLGQVVGQIAQKTATLTQEQRAQALATIFGRDAASSMMVLLAQGQRALDGFTRGLRNSGGAAQQTASIMRQNVNASMEEFRGAVESLQIALVSRLAPAMTRLVTGLTNLVNWFTSLSPATQNVIMALTGLVAAVGPLLLILGTLVRSMQTLQIAMAALSGPVGIVVAALAVLVAAFVRAYTTSETFRTIVKSVFNAVVQVVSVSMRLIQSVISTVMAVIRGDWTSAFNGIKSITSAIFAAIRTIVSASINAIKNVITTNITGAVNLVKSALSSLPGIFSRVWNAAVGVVSGAASRIRSIISGIADSIRSVSASINSLQATAARVVSGVRSSVSRAAGSLRNSIPGLATGGRIVAPGLAIVGEEGPELVSLSRGAQVTPLTHGGGGTGGGVQLNQTINTTANPKEIQFYTERALRRVAVEWGV